MSQLNIVAMITIKPEFQTDFDLLFKKLVEESRKEEGCLRYELNQCLDNVNLYFVIETWNSLQAIDYHKATPHFVEFANYAQTHVDSLQISVVKPVM